MTTQRFDKLMQDERTVTALLRAGRCAKHVHFQMPTSIQINGLFRTMFATYGHKTNASENKEEEEIILVAQEFSKVLQSEEDAYWTRYNTALNKENTNEQRKHAEDNTDVGKGTPTCWKATVDWDSIKGYLRPLLSNTEGYQRAANNESVRHFLKTQQLTKRAEFNQQLDVELEKVDEALLLNTTRKSNVAIRASASFDAQYVCNQIISPLTGWASFDQIFIDDKELHSKMSQVKLM